MGDQNTTIDPGTALVGEMPTHPKTPGFEVLTDAQRRAMMAENFKKHAPPPPPADLQRYRLEPLKKLPRTPLPPDAVVDEVAEKAAAEADEIAAKAAQKTIKSIDPLWPMTFPLFADVATPREISHEGTVIGSLVDAGVGPAWQLYLIPEALDVLLANIGIDDDPSVVDERFEEQGADAMRACMQYDPPKSQLQKWRREADARLSQAESVGRWYAMRPESIARVTGRPYVARKLLHVVGGKAKSLSLQLAKELAEAEREAQRLAAEFEEQHRPNKRSLLDLGLVGVHVDLREFMAAFPPLLNPAAAVHFTDTQDEFYFAWRPIPGLPLPDHCQFAGCCRVLEHTAIIPVMPARSIENIGEASNELFALTVGLRKKFLPSIDRGPISKNRWSDEGLPVADELLARFGAALAQPLHGLQWAQRHVIEAIVRGALVRPDVAIDLVWTHPVGEHEQNIEKSRPRVPKHAKKYGTTDPSEPLLPTYGIKRPGTAPADLVDAEGWEPPPPSPSLSREALERIALEAEMRGEVAPGSLLVSKENTPKAKATKGR